MPPTPPENKPLSTLAAVGLLEGLADLHQAVLVVDVTDGKGQVAWISDELEVLRGCGEDLQGRDAKELFLADRYLDLANQFRSTGRITNARVELVRRDGAAIPVEVSAVRIPSDPPGSSYVVAILRTLEQRERRDRELRDTVQYYRAILDSSSQAVIAMDRSGFVSYANAAASALLGIPLEELLDQPAALVFPDAGKLQRVISALRIDSEFPTADLEFERGEGDRVCLSISASCIRLADGTRAGTVAFLHDVTERRRFEDRLARKNTELEHYVHAVSHDLRTPLVSLLGFSRLLGEDYGEVLDEAGRHFLDRVVQAGRTMESLINDLLELSRIGEARGQQEPVNPLEVLQQLRAEIKPRLDERSIQLRLPEHPTTIVCDRTELYRVFANLVGNAIDHMGERAGARITVEVDADADGHLLRVSDNGVGIAPEHHERIFEVFQTVGPRDRRRTGVGLAIVKKIAETHGGRVWVESDSGQGATFTVELPRS